MNDPVLIKLIIIQTKNAKGVLSNIQPPFTSEHFYNTGVQILASNLDEAKMFASYILLSGLSRIFASGAPYPVERQLVGDPKYAFTTVISEAVTDI